MKENGIGMGVLGEYQSGQKGPSIPLVDVVRVMPSMVWGQRDAMGNPSPSHK